MSLRIALVIAGMQSRYLADIPVSAQAEIVNGVDDVLRVQKRQIPVVFVEYAGGGKTVSGVRQLVTHRLDKDYQEMTRRCRGTIAGTEIDVFLRSQSIDTIIVAGVHASYYIHETVVDALKADYRVITAPDLIADNPILSARAMWRWYGQNTTFYAHSAELRAIEIG